MEHVFIPSKNRAKNSSFIRICYEAKVDFTVVLEGHEVSQYLSYYPDLTHLILPESSKGITYVRNYIKDFAQDAGMSYFWMIDDDVTGLYKREQQKMIKGGIEILEQAERQLQSLPNCAIGSIEYQQLAWSATKDEVKDSFCDSIVLINNVLTRDLHYREYVEGKEDRDFAMQCIEAGFNTYRTTLYGFAAPSNGSNEGGLKEIFYDAGREQTCAERMLEIWGANICQQITKPSGRPDVKIYWDRIRGKKYSIF